MKKFAVALVYYKRDSSMVKQYLCLSEVRAISEHEALGYAINLNKKDDTFKDYALGLNTVIEISDEQEESKEDTKEFEKVN
jgi:hypothetical protein